MSHNDAQWEAQNDIKYHSDISKQEYIVKKADAYVAQGKSREYGRAQAEEHYGFFQRENDKLRAAQEDQKRRQEQAARHCQQPSENDNLAVIPQNLVVIRDPGRVRIIDPRL